MELEHSISKVLEGSQDADADADAGVRRQAVIGW